MAPEPRFERDVYVRDVLEVAVALSRAGSTVEAAIESAINCFCTSACCSCCPWSSRTSESGTPSTFCRESEFRLAVVMTGGVGVEGTERSQRAGASNRPSMPTCKSKSEIVVVYGGGGGGMSIMTPNTSRTKDRRRTCGLKSDSHRSQISPGMVQEHISPSMTLCEEQWTRIDYTGKCGHCTVRSQVDILGWHFGAIHNTKAAFSLQLIP